MGVLEAAGFRTMDALVTYIMRPGKDAHREVRPVGVIRDATRGRHRRHRRHHRARPTAAIAAVSTSTRTCRPSVPTRFYLEWARPVPGAARWPTWSSSPEDAAGRVSGYLAYRRREPVSSDRHADLRRRPRRLPARQPRAPTPASSRMAAARARSRRGERVPDAELQLPRHPRLRGRPASTTCAPSTRCTPGSADARRQAAVLEFAGCPARADNAPGRHGRLAQLGERRVRNAEVRSSILLPSTTTPPGAPRILEPCTLPGPRLALAACLTLATALAGRPGGRRAARSPGRPGPPGPGPLRHRPATSRASSPRPTRAACCAPRRPSAARSSSSGPGEMRWVYTAPERKEFVSDGVKIYAYFPADRQVHRQRRADRRRHDPGALPDRPGQPGARLRRRRPWTVPGAAAGPARPEAGGQASPTPTSSGWPSPSIRPPSRSASSSPSTARAGARRSPSRT